MPATSHLGSEILSLEWPLLLACCSAHDDAAKVAALMTELADCEPLLKLAEEHGVVARAAAALSALPEGRVPGDLLNALRERHRKQTLLSLGITSELFRILEILRKANIECAVVKGPALALRAYGDAAARRYVDLDFLVRQADLERALQPLSAAGYTLRMSGAAIRSGKIPGEYLFRRDTTNFIFELHTEKTFRYFPLPLPIEAFLRRKTSLSLDGQTVPVLCGEDEFLLISVHGAKHFWERLMWIADVAAMLRSYPHMDWNGVRKSAAAVGAGRMVRVALLLAEQILAAPLPTAMSGEVQSDSVCAKLVAQISRWLPFAGSASPAVAQRAHFRFRICDSALTGARYLAKLSFSTTEDDWTNDAGAPRSGFMEAVRRPFRLMRKYPRV